MTLRSEEAIMDGIRFERRGEGDYYKVILHVGSTYVPISDEDVEALKKESALSGAFLEFFLDRIGYSPYLKDQLKTEQGRRSYKYLYLPFAPPYPSISLGYAQGRLLCPSVRPLSDNPSLGKIGNSSEQLSLLRQSIQEDSSESRIRRPHGHQIT